MEYDHIYHCGKCAWRGGFAFAFEFFERKFQQGQKNQMGKFDFGTFDAWRFGFDFVCTI